MKQNLALIVMIGVIVIAAYWWALGGYFATDDWFHIDKKVLRVGLRAFVSDFYTGETGLGGRFRPLNRLSLCLDHFLFGKQAWGYHLVNLSLHVLTCLLVYLLAFQLLRHRVQAFFSSLTFGLFPILQQPVFWISSRADLLVTVFALLTVNLFINYLIRGKTIFYYLAVFSALLAFCSKETSAALPVLILLIPLLCWSELGRNKVHSRTVVLGNSLLFLLLFALYFVYIANILGALRPYFGQAFKIEKFQLTYNTFLSFLYYPFWQDFVRFDLPRFILYLLFPVAIIFASSKRGVVAYAWLWVLITVFPMLSLSISPWEGGRYLYLPLVGWALFLPQAVLEIIRLFLYLAIEVEKENQRRLTKKIETISFAFIYSVVLVVFLVKLVPENIHWYKQASERRQLIARAIAAIREKEGQYPPQQLPPISFIAATTRSPSGLFIPWFSMHQAIKILVNEDWELVPGFITTTTSQSLALYIHPDLQLSWKRIKKIEQREWNLSSILKEWKLGDGISYKVVSSLSEILSNTGETGLFAGSPQGDRALYSPVLNIADAWHLVVIYEQPVVMERGSVSWREWGEQFYPYQSREIFNDFHWLKPGKPVFLDYIKYLVQLRIEPIDTAGKYYLSKIELYSYFLE